MAAVNKVKELTARLRALPAKDRLQVVEAVMTPKMQWELDTAFLQKLRARNRRAAVRKLKRAIDESVREVRRGL